jgi:hypothetical protein
MPDVSPVPWTVAILILWALVMLFGWGVLALEVVG